jgi:hypothetical protein
MHDRIVARSSTVLAAELLRAIDLGDTAAVLALVEQVPIRRRQALARTLVNAGLPVTVAPGQEGRILRHLPGGHHLLVDLGFDQSAVIRRPRERRSPS